MGEGGLYREAGLAGYTHLVPSDPGSLYHSSFHRGLCADRIPGSYPTPPAALSPVPRAPRGTSADPYPDTLVRQVGRGCPKQTPLQSYEFVYPACPIGQLTEPGLILRAQPLLPLSKTEPYAPSSV